MRKKNRKTLIVMRVVITVCLVATVVFIFSNSAQPAADSSIRSIAATGFLSRLLERLGSSAGITEKLVRKLAHVGEYLLLGFWLIFGLRLYFRQYLRNLPLALFVGLFIAVLDEFLQLHVPGRSGQVSDILLDFAGVLGGILAGLFIQQLMCLLWDRGKKR